MPPKIHVGQKRQLIIFVNLEGVDTKKNDIFIKFSQERARCLGVAYSAINVFVDSHEQCQYQDVGVIENETLFGTTEHLMPKQIEMAEAKNRIFSEFKRYANYIEGKYDYILIVGEMMRSSSGHSISEIRRLRHLSACIKSIILEHSNKTLHLRVQVCFSGQLTLPGSTQTFAASLIPEDRNVFLSAPTGWSIIARNGSAIDFNLVSDHCFEIWAPFLNSAIQNNWNLLQLIEKFDELENLSKRKSIGWKKLVDYIKHHPETRLESLNIKLHYPSKNVYEKIFAQLSQFEFRRFTPISSPSPIASRSPFSTTPYFFRAITPTVAEDRPRESPKIAFEG